MVDALDELHLAGKQPQQAALSLISLTYGATLGEMSALEEVVAQLLVRQPAPLLRPLHLQALWWAVDRAHRALLAAPSTAPQGPNPESSGEGAAGAGTAGDSGFGTDVEASSGNPENPSGGPVSAAEAALCELRGGLELLAMVAARRPEVIGERLPLLLKVQDKGSRSRDRELR